jgi:hypothetical protein
MLTEFGGRWDDWLARHRRGVGGARLGAFLHPVLERVDLLGLQGVELVLDASEPEILGEGHEILARQVQFLGKLEQSHLFVFFFRTRILLQAQLLSGYSEHPRALPRAGRGFCRNGRYRPE